MYSIFGPWGQNSLLLHRSTKDDGWFSLSMISSVEGEAVAPGEINTSYTRTIVESIFYLNNLLHFPKKLI